MRVKDNRDPRLLPESQEREHGHWAARLDASRERWAMWASLGFVGGTLLSLMGAVMLVVNWFLASQRFGALHSILRTTATLMLVSIAPLLLFGGYCLDRLDRRPPS